MTYVSPSCSKTSGESYLRTSLLQTQSPSVAPLPRHSLDPAPEASPASLRTTANSVLEASTTKSVSLPPPRKTTAPASENGRQFRPSAERQSSTVIGSPLKAYRFSPPRYSTINASPAYCLTRQAMAPGGP